MADAPRDGEQEHTVEDAVNVAEGSTPEGKSSGGAGERDDVTLDVRTPGRAGGDGTDEPAVAAASRSGKAAEAAGASEAAADRGKPGGPAVSADEAAAADGKAPAAAGASEGAAGRGKSGGPGKADGATGPAASRSGKAPADEPAAADGKAPAASRSSKTPADAPEDAANRGKSGGPAASADTAASRSGKAPAAAGASEGAADRGKSGRPAVSADELAAADGKTPAASGTGKARAAAGPSEGAAGRGKSGGPEKADDTAAGRGKSGRPADTAASDDSTAPADAPEAADSALKAAEPTAGAPGAADAVDAPGKPAHAPTPVARPACPVPPPEAPAPSAPPSAPAAGRTAAPAATGSATPAASQSVAPAATGSAGPAATGPAATGSAPSAASRTAAPAASGSPAPAATGSATPAAGRTAAPAASQSAAPAATGSAPSAASRTAPPAAGRSAASAASGSAAPAASRTAAPAASQPAPPAASRPAPPAAGQSAATGSPAPAASRTPAPGAPVPPPAAPASTDELSRTRLQPIQPPPDVPLKLLAELTNTPPPPETLLRTSARRVKIWTPLVLLLVVAFCLVQALRPLPTPALVLSAPASYTFAGSQPAIPWPSEGQAALEVQGLGSMGTFGAQKAEPIASVAKIMTAYVVLHDHPMKIGSTGAQLTVDAQAAADFNLGAEGESVVKVTAGQKISQYEAMEDIMIASANNIARMLARWDAGSEQAFVRKMNATAKRFGMDQTTYTDPSGLTATTVSTATDQVRLAEKAMADPVFRKVVDEPGYRTAGGDAYNNWNHLVGTNNVIGIKTGTSTKAGGNLVFAATKEVGGTQQLIIGAVLGQYKPSILDTVTAASLQLVLTAQQTLTSADVIKKGDVVGHVDDGLGGSTPVVATRAVRAVGWPGIKVDIGLRSGDIHHSAKKGTKVGTLTVGSGPGQVRVPVALASDLKVPGFGSKLTRLG